MHLLTTTSASIDELVEAIDLRQAPGDIVILWVTERHLRAASRGAHGRIYSRRRSGRSRPSGRVLSARTALYSNHLLSRNAAGSRHGSNRCISAGTDRT